MENEVFGLARENKEMEGEEDLEKDLIKEEVYVNQNMVKKIE